MTRPFSVDLGWTALLADLDIRPADLLRRADLPEDLFSRPRPVLEPEAYVRIWAAMSDSLRTNAPGLVLGQTLSDNTFGPQQLAVFCSPDLTSAIERLAEYKPLVGPVQLEVHDTLGGLEVTIDAVDATLPAELFAAELVSLVHIARLALKEDIRPMAVELIDPPQQPDYETYFRRPLRRGPFNRVVFDRDYAAKPFLPPDPGLFSAFEPDLRARLDELDQHSTCAERVRSLLMEALPCGRAEAVHVAKRLGVSTRSLQRRLAKEGTTFKDELQALRTRLARHYLGEHTRSSAEIAFLLGYEDPNSFIRAFHDWTGTTPEAMRRELTKGNR